MIGDSNILVPSTGSESRPRWYLARNLMRKLLRWIELRRGGSIARGERYLCRRMHCCLCYHLLFYEGCRHMRYLHAGYRDTPIKPP